MGKSGKIKVTEKKLDAFDKWFESIHERGSAKDDPEECPKEDGGKAAVSGDPAEGTEREERKKKAECKPKHMGTVDKLLSGQSIFDSATRERALQARARAQKAKSKSDQTGEDSSGRRRFAKESLNKFLDCLGEDSLDDSDLFSKRTNTGSSLESSPTGRGNTNSLRSSRHFRTTKLLPKPPTGRLPRIGSRDELGSSSCHVRRTSSRDELGSSSCHVRRTGSRDELGSSSSHVRRTRVSSRIEDELGLSSLHTRRQRTLASPKFGSFDSALPPKPSGLPRYPSADDGFGKITYHNQKWAVDKGGTPPTSPDTSSTSSRRSRCQLTITPSPHDDDKVVIELDKETLISLLSAKAASPIAPELSVAPRAKRSSVGQQSRSATYAGTKRPSNRNGMTRKPSGGDLEKDFLSCKMKELKF